MTDPTVVTDASADVSVDDVPPDTSTVNVAITDPQDGTCARCGQTGQFTMSPNGNIAGLPPGWCNAIMVDASLVNRTIYLLCMSCSTIVTNCLTGAPAS